jgi:hypothetical protein
MFLPLGNTMKWGYSSVPAVDCPHHRFLGNQIQEVRYARVGALHGAV